MEERRSYRGAQELRAEFDEAFARPAAAAPGTVSLLALRVGPEPFAVRLLEAGGLQRLRHLVPVPTRRSEVLGVTGLRGEVIPVFGLGRLVLDRPDEPPRWILLAGGAERVAFAFTAFDGHIVASAEELRPGPGEAGRRHVRELYTGSPSRPVLDLPSLVAAAITVRESP